MDFEHLLIELQASPFDVSLHQKIQQLIGRMGEKNPIILSDYNPTVIDLLKILFDSTLINPQYLAYLSAGQILKKYRITPDTDPASGDDRMLLRLAQDTFFLALLEKVVNTHPELEHFLTRLRRHILFFYQSGQVFHEHLFPLLPALAQQAFNNEYVWYEQEDECEAVERLAVQLTMLAGQENNTIDVPLMVCGMYRCLADLPCASHLGERSSASFSPSIQTAITRLVIEPLDEKHIVNEIPSFAVITDGTSKAVQRQYEENPYPRWLHLYYSDTDVGATLKKKKPNFSWPTEFYNRPQDILVPGCGTGRHPLMLAAGNPEAHVWAIDLSKASLAFGKLMASKFKIDNITFLHGDLLDIPILNRQFHHIDCVGVLHHLENPMAGWHTLEQVLTPGGTMRVGVYSQVARLPVVFFRNVIEKQQIDTKTKAMRVFRHQLMTQKKFETLYQSISSTDFFSMSTFRDLLFHVCEHRYTLMELYQIIDNLGFKFLGFNIFSAALKKKYRERFPDDPDMNSFDNWRRFEQQYTGTRSMFDFWLQKRW